MARLTVLILLSFSALMAQVGRLGNFPPQLKQYMEFTDAQVNSIIQLNSSSQTFQTEKFRRSAQVQFELAEETAKTPIDPMALGVRHLELEAIRRELKADQDRTTAEIQKVLTPAQKTKLEALQQAMRLQGVICEAQGVNVLPSQLAPGLAVLQPVQPVPPVMGSVLPGSRIYPQFGLCVPGIRTGDFGNFLLGPPNQP